MWGDDEDDGDDDDGGDDVFINAPVNDGFFSLC